MEEWREIPGTDYSVSNFGLVRNNKTQRILNTWKRGKYLAVNLGLQNPYYIHKLVAEIFLEKIEGFDIDHINRNKHDNRLCNLRYVSKSQNRANTSCLITNKLKEKNIQQKPNGSYSVRIFREGKYCMMKSFYTLEEAKQARDFFIASNY